MKLFCQCVDVEVSADLVERGTKLAEKFVNKT